MKTLNFQDDGGETFTVQDDDGCYFATNVAAQTIDNLKDFKAREDDVLIVTYPKSGTHWLNAIVTMLVEGLDSLSTKYLMHTEYTAIEVIDDSSSPRVLCTHLPFSRIPADFLRKRSRIVLCVRNPYDVVVSYYWFARKLEAIAYKGTFNNFLSLFVNGRLPYNSWFEHVSTWLRAARSDQHNVHVVCYEDLQQNFSQAVLKLARFLKIDFDSDKQQCVQRETSFKNMRRKLVLDSDDEPSRTIQSVIYRNGQVGDWRNHFNSTQLSLVDSELRTWDLHGDKEVRTPFHPGSPKCIRANVEAVS